MGISNIHSLFNDVSDKFVDFSERVGSKTFNDAVIGLGMTAGLAFIPLQHATSTGNPLTFPAIVGATYLTALGLGLAGSAQRKREQARSAPGNNP